MQIWTGRRALCFQCSLRDLAGWKLGSPSERPFGTVPGLLRHRVGERISKGHWKESILSPLGVSLRLARLSESRSPNDPVGGSKKGLVGKRLRLQESGGTVTELELHSLKKTLQEGKASPGILSSHAGLDPELKYYDSFEAKITNCFVESGRRRGGAIPTPALKDTLEQAFMHDGRTGLRRALLFAYIDHITECQPKTADNSLASNHLDLRYPTEWYSLARTMQRVIHLHVGPTNSGKTYHALKRLEESGNGLYAGPLRLLAHEVYTRFNNKGMACDLVTGDDVRMVGDREAKLSSHTVEMVDLGRLVDVAVIDEIQMIAHEERGWAWTRALLGTRAKELHLCGETRVIPLIRELAASMGDTLHIHHYDRLNPLKAMSKSLRGQLKDLRRGDCIVSFSVVGIHGMKKQIELDTGRRVAVVYGSLPPEIRAQQAALFNDPNNDYDFLVASDAIGMGLNLSIKRIIFETIWKKDDLGRVKLSVSQIKQIAGRAGRYRTANQDEKVNQAETELIDSQESRLSSFKGSVKQSNVGLVTCLDERDLYDIQTALNGEPDPIKAAGIQPPSEFIDAFANTLPTSTPFEYLLDRVRKEVVVHPRFFMCKSKDQLMIAGCIESVQRLSIVQNWAFVNAPVDSRSETGRKVVQALASCIATRQAVTIVDVAEIPLDILDDPVSGDRSYLANLEVLHKSLILYLWLSYRFTNIFLDREMAIHAKELVEEKINTTLLEFSANPKLRTKLLMMRHAEHAEDMPHKSPDGAGAAASETAVPGPAETELSESLNDFSALPVDWESRPSAENLNLDDGALEVQQPTTTRP